MDERARGFPTGVTAGVIYLVAAVIVVAFLFGLTALGLPPVVATGGLVLLAVGFPVAVLLAVILRPEWLRAARHGAAALFTLYLR